MKLITAHIFFFLLLGIFSNIRAQNITIDAIEIGSVYQNGTGEFPSVNSFLSNTRNPALFRTSILNEMEHSGSFTKGGFRIDFIFRLLKNPRHQFVAGIERATVETDLFSVQGSYRDTLAVSTNYKTRNEYFFLKPGYQFVHRPEKRFTILAGGQLNLGIPVSSRTREIINIDELREEEFSFFGKQAPSFGLSIPFGIRFKLLQNVSGSLLITQSFQYYRVDGTPMFTSLTGTNIGLHFKLREQ